MRSVSHGLAGHIEADFADTPKSCWMSSAPTASHIRTASCPPAEVGIRDALRRSNVRFTFSALGLAGPRFPFLFPTYRIEHASLGKIF